MTACSNASGLCPWCSQRHRRGPCGHRLYLQMAGRPIRISKHHGTEDRMTTPPRSVCPDDAGAPAAPPVHPIPCTGLRSASLQAQSSNHGCSQRVGLAASESNLPAHISLPPAGDIRMPAPTQSNAYGATLYNGRYCPDAPRCGERLHPSYPAFLSDCGWSAISDTSTHSWPSAKSPCSPTAIPMGEPKKDAASDVR
jgi:hypothetical protein